MLIRLIKFEFEYTDYNMHIESPKSNLLKMLGLFTCILHNIFQFFKDRKKSVIANIKSTNQRPLYNCKNTTQLSKYTKVFSTILYIS